MKQLIRAFLAGAGKDIITASEARALGCSQDVVVGMVRAKELVRLARGTYARAEALNPPYDSPLRADRFALARHRHRLRLDALLRHFGPSVAASHQSAVLAWGLPTLLTSLDRVHLVHATPGKSARRRADHTIHTCELADVITRHDGRLLVVPSLAVIGQSLTVGLAAGVEAMDSAIVRGHVTTAELEAMLTRMRRTPGLTLARRAVDLVDGLAESPGETRLRLVLIELGFAFSAQHWIRIEANSAFYRVDFYLPELGVVLEYDGQVKYGDVGRTADLRGGNAPRDDGRTALAKEKQREDDLRRDGFGVGRVTASHLTPKRVTGIIEAAATMAQPRAFHRPAEPPPWARRP